MWEKKEQSVKRKSLDNEKRLSQKINFQLTKGSGNQPYISKKGDGKTERFVFECKETKSNILKVEGVELVKLWGNAIKAGKDPILVLSIYGICEPVPQDWVAMPVELFNELIKEG